MTAVFSKNKLPRHLFNIPELEFSSDLLGERLAGPWFRLGAWTSTSSLHEGRVEDETMRLSLLLPPDGFATVFDKLDSIGNALHTLGEPGGAVYHSGNVKDYSYAPFHHFEFPFTSVVGEPIVFLRNTPNEARLFINPDVWMFFGLEEKSRGSGVWSDPRRGVEVLSRRVIDGLLQTVEIRTDYLLKYLQARQMSLIVGHYRHLHLHKPDRNAIKAFVKGDLTIGSAKQGSKAILQNWGLRQGSTHRSEYLQRRLHLWLEIKPPAIDIEHPWDETPTFDPYTFTFPMSVGSVAPARWKNFPNKKVRRFKGVNCDFMDRAYFRQEVLAKYEVASGFDIKDDGSVVCGSYWGLTRSTSRIGNELLATGIGDFAEGVPFEEWPHWKEYAVEPPSANSVKAYRQELPIPETVNSLVNALHRLDTVFAEMAVSFGVTIEEPLWSGSLNSLAGRQLKWVYPATAGDDEFIKRATLASTLFLDGLQSASLRKFLIAMDKKLHETFDRSPKPLGSRNLLQRTTLIAMLIESISPKMSGIPGLVKHAEGKGKDTLGTDLQAELTGLYKQVQEEFAPLAFLYDLRVHGGLAHPPNKRQAENAASKLGLSKGGWHRTDYLRLLQLITESFVQIGTHLEVAARLIGSPH